MSCEPFEAEAVRAATAALTDCIERLKKLKVSVSTDYHVGEAIGRVEGALADMRCAAACMESALPKQTVLFDEEEQLQQVAED